MSIAEKYSLFKQYQENSGLNKRLIQIAISDFIIQIDKLNEKVEGSFNLKPVIKSLSKCFTTFFLFIFQKKNTFKNLYNFQTIKGHIKIFSKKGVFERALV